MPDHLNEPVLLVGVGEIGVVYANVLTHLGFMPTVVGRGTAGVERFEAATGIKARPGGLTNWLATGAAAPPSCIVAVDVENLAAATIELARCGVRRVLVEKPGGVDANEIAAVRRAADEFGCEVFLAYNRRFLASTTMARRLIAEDGGVTSFGFEFTELADRVAQTVHSQRVKAAWFVANSSHVIDLAFFLGGRPSTMAAFVDGELSWHKPARFSGSGRSSAGALFRYHADWSSAGRWGVEISTPQRRLIMRPLESLQEQRLGSFDIRPISLDDEADRMFKPGFLKQVEMFMNGRDNDLQNIRTQDDMMRGEFAVIRNGGKLEAPIP